MLFDRRGLLRGSAALGGVGLLGGCATSVGAQAALTTASPSRYRPTLAPLRASKDRIFDITVCLRPFRAAGPRLDAETVGDTLVVHNYGHGGSGWSLSWGSSTIAVQKVMANSPRDVAVIGCGVLGLTSAILAQNAGANVTIYAHDLLPDTRSARATGTWTPDSRIALTDKAAPGFPALWEQMARTSWKTYRRYLGLPGNPVEWVERYNLFDAAPSGGGLQAGELDFADYGDRIRDLTPRQETLAPGSTPFSTPIVRRTETLIFNIADYGHTLMADFLARGGQFRHMTFNTPAEIGALKEKAVINCPGYGARALWRDESIVPVRGQIAWLIPQPELNYGLYYHGVSVVPRRDGIVVQALSGGDMRGYGDDNETPNRAEADEAVAVLADLYSRFGLNAAAAPPTR